MDSYNLSYTPGFEQQKRLSDLARRCRDINGWGVQELLQHAATANSKAEIELKLDFLEDEGDPFGNRGPCCGSQGTPVHHRQGAGRLPEGGGGI